MHVRSAAQNTVGNARRPLHDALAAIEDQQHSPLAQSGDDARGRIGREVVQPERKRNGSGHRLISVQGGKIDPLNAVAIRATHGIGQRTGDGRLPDAAWSNDADEPLLRQLGLNSGDDVAAPVHPAQVDRPSARLYRRWYRDAGARRLITERTDETVATA